MMRLVVVHFRMFRRGQHRLCHGERFTYLLKRKRLQKIVLNPARQKIAVQAHVIHLACSDHDRSGFTDFGKRIDIVDRIARFRHVDEQDVRAGRNRKRLHGVAQATLVTFFDRPAHVVGGSADQLQRIVITDEGIEGITQSC